MDNKEYIFKYVDDSKQKSIKYKLDTGTLEIVNWEGLKRGDFTTVCLTEEEGINLYNILKEIYENYSSNSIMQYYEKIYNQEKVDIDNAIMTMKAIPNKNLK